MKAGFFPQITNVNFFAIVFYGSEQNFEDFCEGVNTVMHAVNADSGIFSIDPDIADIPFISLTMDCEHFKKTAHMFRE